VPNPAPSHADAARDDVEPDSRAFYRHMMEALRADGVPFLVGGAFAFAHYTGIRRNTKDLDLFILRRDWERVEQVVRAAGYQAELTFPHWLAKVHRGDAFIDLIFNSGNGVSPVEESWFAAAPEVELLGVPVRLTPPEETLWTKAFIMERERYDGADVAHLLQSCAETLDWPRLRLLFGENWRVLLSHLVLFGFVYPGERDRLPVWLIDELSEQLRREARAAERGAPLCAGTLLSREQYLPDVAQRGYEDVRLGPQSTMTTRDVAEWTAAIDDPEQPTAAPVILTPAPTPRRRRRAA